MIGLVLNKNFWIGAAMASSIVGGYTILWYGPQQYRAGGDAKGLELTQATHEAAKGITDAAERAKFHRRHCTSSGGVWSFERSECIN